MRKAAILASALALVWSSGARAGNSNQTVNIQGVLRDATGSLQSMAVGLVVSLYPTQTGGKAFYSQNFTTVPVDNGYFSVELAGPGLSFQGLSDAWVGVQVSGDPSELPRQHIGAAPFAFSAASLDATACSGCVQDGMIAAVSAAKVSGVLPIAAGGTGSATKSFVDLSSDQPNIAGNKTFTGLVATARDVGGTPMRVCTGATTPGNTAWTVYGTGGNALTVNVDTSGCGFSGTPHYVTSLGCKNNCWTAVGGSSVYNASSSGFQIFLQYPVGVTPADANSNQWHIEWMAIGN